MCNFTIFTYEPLIFPVVLAHNKSKRRHYIYVRVSLKLYINTDIYKSVFVLQNSLTPKRFMYFNLPIENNMCIICTDMQECLEISCL